MTRDSAVEHDAEIAKRFPLIAEVMTYIAHPQIRNRGTFGGAIAHADPAAQLPAISLVDERQLKILKKGGERWVAGGRFLPRAFHDRDRTGRNAGRSGAARRCRARTGSSYKQVSRQRGGYAQVAVASVVTLDEDGQLHSRCAWC